MGVISNLKGIDGGQSSAFVTTVSPRRVPIPSESDMGWSSDKGWWADDGKKKRIEAGSRNLMKAAFLNSNGSEIVSLRKKGIVGRSSCLGAQSGQGTMNDIV